MSRTRAVRLRDLAVQLMDAIIARTTCANRAYDRTDSAMDHGLWPLVHDCFAIARGERAPSGLTDDEVEAQALREVNTVYKA